MDFSYHKRKRSDEQCTHLDSDSDSDSGCDRITFSECSVKNTRLDTYTKTISLKASPSIVCLVSYTGGKELFQCTGTVMEIENGQSIILTSASLLRSFTVENSVAENIKIIVYLPDKSSIPGQVEAFDLHFNVAAIRIDKQLPVASFTHVNDAISIDLDELHSSQSQLEMSLRPHRSRSFDLIPGEPVIALGRFSKEPYEFMAAPGEFCLCHIDEDRDGFHCNVFLKASCSISRCGVGGPLINRFAEVIGICFFAAASTPFLPINIVTLWWEHYKEYRQPRYPLLGMETANLYAVDLFFLGRIIQKFPGVVKGVLVKEVFQDSPVESAGLKSKDVIVQFGGKKVQSFLELYESMWHKVGETVALTVARQSDGFADLEMVVEEVASDDLYSFFLAYGVCFRVSIGPAEIQMDHKWVGLMSAPWLTLLATI